MSFEVIMRGGGAPESPYWEKEGPRGKKKGKFEDGLG